MMRRLFLAVAVTLLAAPSSRAQEPPPRIPWYVLDVHGTIPQFPSNANLAASRDMQLGELPGVGVGLQAALHFYPLRWRQITFGIGGEVTANRSRSQPLAATSLRGAEEKFLSASPQLSFNFGSGNGWSYLSGGVGLSQWSLIPDGRDEPFPGDTDRLKTLNYG